MIIIFHHLPNLLIPSNLTTYNGPENVLNYDEYYLGLLAGDLIDGTIALWNPAPLISISYHQSPPIKPYTR